MKKTKYIVSTPSVTLVVKKPILYTSDPEACLCELKDGKLECLKGFAYFLSLEDEFIAKIIKNFSDE